MEIYRKLETYFGEQNWWPGETPFEVIIGAILTQQTAWKNVEIAIKRLKEGGLLEPKGLAKISERKLRAIIRSTGFYKQKAKRLKNISAYIYKDYGNNLNSFLNKETEELRDELLSLDGIGMETADSILLYASDKLRFVVDAYTIRICNRLALIRSDDYFKIQEFFERNLPRDIELYREYHALIVVLGKNYCKKKPICVNCPLNDLCNYARKDGKNQKID